MDTIGIKNIDSIYFMNSFSLKTEYLYFDRLIYNQNILNQSMRIGEYFSKLICDRSGKLFKKNMDEIELLQKQGLLIPYKTVILNAPNECFDISTKTNFIALRQYLLDIQTKTDVLIDNLAKSKQDNFLKITNDIFTSSLESSEVSSIISSILLNFKGEDVIPVIQSKKSLQQNKESKSSINLIVNRFPYIDSSIEWERIFEYKENNDAKLKLLNLKNWLIDLSKNEYTIKEIEQKLDYLIEEYEKQIKLHKIKIKYHKLDLILSSTIGVIENVIKGNLTEIGKNILTLKKEDIDLVMEESNLKGNEIAYISDVTKEFDNERNRIIKNSL